MDCRALRSLCGKLLGGFAPELAFGLRTQAGQLRIEWVASRYSSPSWQAAPFWVAPTSACSLKDFFPDIVKIGDTNEVQDVLTSKYLRI